MRVDRNSKSLDFGTFTHVVCSINRIGQISVIWHLDFGLAVFFIAFVLNFSYE